MVIECICGNTIYYFGYVKQLNKETKDRISHLQLLQTGVSIGQYILLVYPLLSSCKFY